ncbi:MAG: phosphomannomutase/phosphoglucomutase, partial [Candidatus ainarchaeum sp.]|nr:phosphomannomutase/phosphoglucomutase [Candidatus ainarchaeum sp.]
MDLENIFKAYDIRGIFPGQLDETVAERLGRAIVVFFNAKKIGVARDMRLGSPELQAALVKGITEQGCDAVDFGLCSTDEYYFCISKTNLAAGAMVTASHNPKQYNGFKITGKKASPIGEETGLLEIKRLVAENSFPRARRAGKVEKKDMLAAFQKMCLAFVGKKNFKKMRVAVDFGNGMASQTAMGAFKKLPVKIIPVCYGLDGGFPNHEANPLVPENRKLIEETVAAEKADLGIAFDGDADRCFFIDDRGRFVPGDFITGLLAKNILQKKKGLVLFDLRCSKFVPRTIEKSGGKWKMCRVGHSFIKQEMKKTGAVFAGELSGHYYYKFRKEGYVSDNGLIPALQIMELLSIEGKKLSELICVAEKEFFVSGEINSEVPDKAAKMKELEGHYRP